MKNGINYSCDDCKNAQAAFKSRNTARKAGWAVAGDYKFCYCPQCAPFHRFGAAIKANKRAEPPQLPDGLRQLKII